MAKVKAGPVNADRLKSFVERIERLEEERKAIGGDVKDVYSEAKGVGYDIKTMRQIVKERSQDAADRDEQETLLDVYRHALGMGTYRSVAAQYGISKSKLHRLVPREENGTRDDAENAAPRACVDDDASVVAADAPPVVVPRICTPQAGEGPASTATPAPEGGEGAGTSFADRLLGVFPKADEAPAPRSVGAVAAEPRVAPQNLAQRMLGTFDEMPDQPAFLRRAT